MTGQHLLLLLWTLWIVFALLSIGDLLGVILLILFGGGFGLVPAGLVSWRLYLAAWLIAHLLAAAFRIFVRDGSLRAPWASEQHGPMPALPAFEQPSRQQESLAAAEPVPAQTPTAAARHSSRQDAPAEEQPSRQPELRDSARRRPLETLSGWLQSWRLQAMCASVSLVGLISLSILRPTVPWMYRADIPIMLLAVFIVVAAEYVLFGRAWRSEIRKKRGKVQARPRSGPDLAANPGDAVEEKGLTSNPDDTVEGKVVSSGQQQASDAEAGNRERINGSEFRLPDVETFLQQHVRDALAHSALESEPSVWFHALDEPTTGVFSVELLRIARLTMRLEGSNGIASRVVGITIERWTGPISLEPGEKVSQAITRVAAETHSNEIEVGAATPGTAQPISPQGWEVVSARWVQADLTGANIAARSAADLGAGLDSILRNETVRPVFSWKAPGSAAAVIGKVAENKETLQVGGIVVGTKSGQPVALSACFWSLARDDLARSLAAGIARELGTLGLSRAPTP